MGVLLGVVLDGGRSAAVRIAFTQHRVHRRADALGIARLDVLFGIGLRVLRIVGDLVALALEFLDRFLQLAHRCRDVGQLDDVGFGRQRELAQFSQVVGNALFLGQQFRELAQNTGCHGNVAFGDFNTGIGRKTANNGQERRGGQTWGFVGQGVDDFRSHCLFQVAKQGAGCSPPSMKARYRKTGPNRGCMQLSAGLRNSLCNAISPYGIRSQDCRCFSSLIQDLPHYPATLIAQEILRRPSENGVDSRQTPPPGPSAIDQFQ
ncbi:hypothetical protein SDC9_139837 [bioreactor metagenome]|uniref:Uncharacterized protein n=1 Tax=bioreactor metagenome TaxID=1076179 RepID=A0A645DWJ7_9ZZZZ